MTHTNKLKIILVFFTISLALHSTADDNTINGRFPVLTVGADANCDYQIGVTGTLQDAIMMGAEETRLAVNTPFNFITLDSLPPMHIIGGYDNCQDAANGIVGTNKSVINGVANISSVITTTNTQVKLENLILQNGNSGLAALIGTTQLKLKNIIIQNNIGGSGILLQSLNGVLLEDVIITGNEAHTGGGIFCSQSSISMVGESSIDNNQAIGGIGGGIFSDSCDITLVGGSNLSFPAGLSDNTSDMAGGGIYLKNDSQLTVTGGNLVIDSINYGDLSKPFNIYNNETITTTPTTAKHGGGIFSDNSQVNLTNVSITNNHALGNGGAVYAINSSLFNINSTYGNCWSDISCNYIGSNTAQIGGAFLFGNNSIANIKSSLITKNRAYIATIVNIGTISTLTLESSFVYANGLNGAPPFSDIGMIRVNNSSQFNLQHTTIVDNASLMNVTEILGQSNALMVNSIIYNPTVGPYVDVVSGTSTAQCLFVDPVNNTTSAQVIGMSTATFNGAFINPGIRDYHLTDTTPLIDSCQTPQINPTALDIDGQAIGYDDPMFGAGLIIYDVGADEVSDILFKDGFE